MGGPAGPAGCRNTRLGGSAGAPRMFAPCEHARVASANNATERALRGVVVRRRMGGQIRVGAAAARRTSTLLTRLLTWGAHGKGRDRGGHARSLGADLILFCPAPTFCTRQGKCQSTPVARNEPNRSRRPDSNSGCAKAGSPRPGQDGGGTGHRRAKADQWWVDRKSVAIRPYAFYIGIFWGHC